MELSLGNFILRLFCHALFYLSSCLLSSLGTFFAFSQSKFHRFLILNSTAFSLWNLLWEFTRFILSPPLSKITPQNHRHFNHLNKAKASRTNADTRQGKMKRINIKRKNTCECKCSFGSPNRARTCDIMINSHALYRLSYRGILNYRFMLRISVMLPFAVPGKRRAYAAPFLRPLHFVDLPSSATGSGSSPHHRLSYRGIL